jgi:hypothetical protein
METGMAMKAHHSGGLQKNSRPIFPKSLTHKTTTTKVGTPVCLMEK